MTNNEQGRLPHLLVTNTAATHPYTSPRPGRGKTLRVPPRQRQTHGERLQRQFDVIRQQATEAVAEQRAFGIDAQHGMYIQFESDPEFDLKFESLEAQGSGVELMSVKEVESTTYATVYVPDGKLDVLTKKLDKYLDPESDSSPGKPRNKDLIDGISSIHKAALDALWTDSRETLPAEGEVIWWEVWLRTGDDPEGTLTFFNEHARQLEMTVLEETLKFPDRTVVAVHGTKEQISRSINLLNCVAELRRMKERADFFTAMGRHEQIEWVNATRDQITPPDPNSPAVCILDTGVNHNHPLLRPVLHEEDVLSYDPTWGGADHHGHGTEMAGLAAYGDLTELLAHNGPINQTYGLESVKILPPRGENEAHLYGNITMEAVFRAEVNAPERSRNFCMAVTTIDFRDGGRPSSWSASIDALCSGANDETQRFIIISAGNTEPRARHFYPNNNMTEGVHDPAQSWNALTVGAYTEKNFIDPVQFPGFELLAPAGDLSPSSCTSMDWFRPWPLKPDIVMEGGNMALAPTGEANNVDSLDLLTTNVHFDLLRPLVNTGDTSAATALAARMGGTIQAQYPDYWPETIRAIIIHSAEWTQAMRDQFAPLRTQPQYERLVRYCGYGVPNIERALWSAKNSLTLIAQDSLQPFDKLDGRTVTRDLNLHAIPWPIDILQDLGNTPVEMRVTLSYFIEPNPARRGWGRKYSYSSHGLRFDVKRSLENLDAFCQRINKAAWDEETGRAGTSPADAKWTLGDKLRKLGSIHSDTWTGTAAELAERGHIAVFPVMGWWKETPRHERWGSRARYALVVTISTPETGVDLYTPVQNLVQVQTQVAIEV